jgi:hypothetical protein
MDCNDLRKENEFLRKKVEFYEEQWKKDKEHWEGEKKKLEERLEQQSDAIRKLKGQLERVESEREINKALLSRPPLGEGFFLHMAREIDLWDRVLLEEGRGLSGKGLKDWLVRLWEERREAIFQALGGQSIGWQRLRTGLVLEWGLLAWLEGARDG